MDTTIRRNEHCIVGMPRCDYVFSSSRSCFIGYGFEASALETSILKRLLEDRSIEPVEAGGSRAPGQNAFCAKICSKIIVSQFCIVLMNHDTDKEGRQVPNANVNMEYGLMLGFNKYVIPFQRRGEALPFNVAGLDTVMYDQRDFERVAGEAIDQALELTTPGATEEPPTSETLFLYLIDEGYLVADISGEGERAIFQIGSPLGFNLLWDAGATKYVYLGNFTHLRSESIIWRAKTLMRGIDGRRASFPQRVAAGVMTDAQKEFADVVFADMKVWLVVTTDDQKHEVERGLAEGDLSYGVRVISMTEVAERIASLGEVHS